MGLDQYAYVAAKKGQRDEYYDKGYYENDSFVSPVTAPREIAYWRKHPNLQGWMENLWIKKGRPGAFSKDFNCVELELSWKDLEKLERDIISGNMAKLDTVGFFFGTASDSYYKEQDLKFIKDAKSELFLGLKVFYNSSW